MQTISQDKVNEAGYLAFNQNMPVNICYGQGRFSLKVFEQADAEIDMIATHDGGEIVWLDEEWKIED